MLYTTVVMRNETNNTTNGKGGTMTTSHLRIAAAHFDSMFDWKMAATLYRDAAKAYPGRIGGLAEADISLLLSRASSCEVMARE